MDPHRLPCLPSMSNFRIASEGLLDTLLILFLQSLITGK